MVEAQGLGGTANEHVLVGQQEQEYKDTVKSSQDKQRSGGTHDTYNERAPVGTAEDKQSQGTLCEQATMRPVELRVPVGTVEARVSAESVKG